MERIYRSYNDTEVAELYVSVQCPHCGEEWQELDKTNCGEVYILTCENVECGKQFEMYFDAD